MPSPPRRLLTPNSPQATATERPLMCAFFLKFYFLYTVFFLQAQAWFSWFFLKGFKKFQAVCLWAETTPCCVFEGLWSTRVWLWFDMYICIFVRVSVLSEERQRNRLGILHFFLLKASISIKVLGPDLVLYCAVCACLCVCVCVCMRLCVCTDFTQLHYPPWCVR